MTFTIQTRFLFNENNTAVPNSINVLRSSGRVLGVDKGVIVLPVGIGYKGGNCATHMREKK